MRSYYDDNFGFYDMDDPEDEEFYREVQKRSVEKECRMCGRTVFIMPQYDICNTCADQIERGFGY